MIEFDWYHINQVRLFVYPAPTSEPIELKISIELHIAHRIVLRYLFPKREDQKKKHLSPHPSPLWKNIYIDMW